MQWHPLYNHAFDRVLSITSSSLVNGRAFQRRSFHTHRNTITCYLWTWSPVERSIQVLLERSTTFPVICCSCLKVFAMCRWHQIQDKYIFKKSIKMQVLKYYAFVLLPIDHILFDLCFTQRPNFLAFRVVRHLDTPYHPPNIIWQCVFHLLPCKQANVLNVSMFRCSWFAHILKLDKHTHQPLQRSRKQFMFITFTLSCCAASFAVFFPHLSAFNVPLIESSLKIQQPNRDRKTLQMCVIVVWRAPLFVRGTPFLCFCSERFHLDRSSIIFPKTHSS